jgi:hypothetical protein
VSASGRRPVGALRLRRRFFIQPHQNRRWNLGTTILESRCANGRHDAKQNIADTRSRWSVGSHSKA